MGLRLSEPGVLLLADRDVIEAPSVEQLADIAVSAAQLARPLLGVRPRVALLSFCTKGSASPNSDSVAGAGLNLWLLNTRKDLPLLLRPQMKDASVRAARWLFTVAIRYGGIWFGL